MVQIAESLEIAPVEECPYIFFHIYNSLKNARTISFQSYRHVEKKIKRLERSLNLQKIFFNRLDTQSVCLEKAIAFSENISHPSIRLKLVGSSQVIIFQ